MKWEGREESSNVEDRRSMGGRGLAIGGAGGLILLVIALFLGVDPGKILGPGGPDPFQEQQRAADPEDDRLASFSKVIFRDTEVVWEEEFQRLGKRYRKPTLVLYRGYVESACGGAESAVGPFYCPGDEKVYIDLSFYRDMERKLKAPGEFARAYVIAHEVGHHVQRLLGYSQRVDEVRRYGSKTEANHASVRLELQADYLAGVWANKGQQKFNFLEPGDVESALHAAFQIGDDRLQRQSRGYVVPDSFTHGTSKQRTRWFSEGLKTGDVRKAAVLFELPYNKL
jgi:uncharacterized protein